MKTSNLRSQNHGFTIVELLIVIVVIGILAAITIVAYNGIRARASDVALRSDLANSAKALANDYTLTSQYPATVAAANQGQGLPNSGGSTSYTYLPVNGTNPPTYSLPGRTREQANTYVVTTPTQRRR